MDDIPPPIPADSNKIMDTLRADLRARGYALSTALSNDEVQQVLACMTGTQKLMIELLYGSGLRLQIEEVLALHQQDLADGFGEIYTHVLNRGRWVSSALWTTNQFQPPN